MVPDSNKTCLGLEYFCFEGDGLWTMSDQELIELGKRELAKLDLIQASDVEDGAVVRMPKAYPVYDSTYHEALQIICQFLSRIDNLQLVGRNGMHKYNNQDHSMLTAMLAAENLQGANHDLWKVNTEQEYHEEVIEDEEKERDKALTQTFARMDKLGFATAVGTVCSLAIVIATLWLVVKGSAAVVPYLQLLEQYFIGYTVTVKGAFIGRNGLWFPVGLHLGVVNCIPTKLLPWHIHVYCEKEGRVIIPERLLRLFLTKLFF